MKKINKILILLFIEIIYMSKCFGQETPKQLGIDFFKSNHTSKIIPKPEIIIKFSKNIGIDKNEEKKMNF